MNKGSYFLCLVFLLIGAIAWLIHYNTVGYLQSTYSGQSEIDRILFEARERGAAAEKVAQEIAAVLPIESKGAVRLSDPAGLPGFQGIVLTSYPVVNHFGFGHEWILYLETDETGRLVGAWKTFRFPTAK